MKGYFAMLVAASLVLSGCAAKPTTAPNPTASATVHLTDTVVPIPTSTTSPTPTPFSELTLKPGDFYFSLDGKPAFVLSRNLTGNTEDDFSLLLEWARQGGTRFIRVHLTHGWSGDPWINKDGTVNEKWAQEWEWFFDQAQTDGISVMPVFGVWADWNNGFPDLGSPYWQYNPLNQANGGPVKDPGELFQPDSATQKMWMAWVQSLVQRWQGRPNIAAWEIFSEINIATGTTDPKGAVAETTAVDFTNKAAAIIRAADTKHRPVTLALAEGAPLTGQWADYYKLNTLDFIEIHPYTEQLDRELVSDVHANLLMYNKPVLIGESGLWGNSAIAKNAITGVKHAIWAGLVSGAMNGRALWSNDGYAFYGSDRGLALQFLGVYATVEQPVANFVKGIDFTGFKPVSSTSTGGVWGAAVGNESSLLGWYRDAYCEPPDWLLQPVVSQQTVALTVPGTVANWRVDFYNTKDGTTLLRSAFVTRTGSTINIPLPDFQDDIAFKMTAQAGTASTSVPAIITTDAIAGTWSGTISSLTGTFSTSVNLSIQAGCKPGKVCGTFAAPQLPCTGDLFLETINGETFLFLEQNVSGAASCKSGGYEQIQLLADRTLSYEYLTTPGSAATSSGILSNP